MTMWLPRLNHKGLAASALDSGGKSCQAMRTLSSPMEKPERRGAEALGQQLTPACLPAMRMGTLEMDPQADQVFR